jgi:predicted branched-subunit amino acid permease
MFSFNRATLSKSLSVSIAVGAYGTAFGAAAVAAGFSVLQSCLLSLLTFTGASQFAVIGVLGAGGTALTGIATASLLGFRNAIYSMIAKPILNVRGMKKFIATQITIDESIAVSTAEEVRGPEAMKHGFWLTGIGVFVFWNLFTLAGALGAQAIGDPAAWGLDAAVPAAFLGLVWPRLKSRDDYVLAISAAVLALALTPIIAAGLPIIATALLAVAFARFIKGEQHG